MRIHGNGASQRQPTAGILLAAQANNVAASCTAQGQARAPEIHLYGRDRKLVTDGSLDVPHRCLTGASGHNEDHELQEAAASKGGLG